MRSQGSWRERGDKADKELKTGRYENNRSMGMARGGGGRPRRNFRKRESNNISCMPEGNAESGFMI